MLVLISIFSLLAAFTLFIAILYFAEKNKIYLITSFACFLGMIYTFSSFFVYTRESILFVLLQQFSATAFLFVVPYFTRAVIEDSKLYKRFLTILSYTGLVISLLFFVGGILNPYSFTEGGFLRFFRNILAFVFMILCLFAITWEAFRFHRFKNINFFLIGLWTGSIFTSIEILKYFINFNLRFPISFFGIGIGSLAFFVFIGMVKRFVLNSIQFKKALDLFERSESRFYQVLENISTAFWISDLKEKTLLYVNPAFEKMWKISSSEIFGDIEIWLKRVHKDDRERVKKIFEDLILDKPFEYRLDFGEENIKWIRENSYLIVNDKGEITRLVRMMEDITDRKLAEEEIRYRLYFDSITGLPNRRALFERYPEEIIKGNRTLVMLDIDNFKMINETFGHEFADRLLENLSKRLKSCLSKNDYLFRLGSDEFMIVLTGYTNEEDILKKVQQIQDKIKEHFEMGKNISIGLSASIGVSLPSLKEEDITRDMAIQRVDVALSKAKLKKNSITVFQPAILEEAKNRFELFNLLKEAVDKQEGFFLVYQPIVNHSGITVGAESLIRWKDSRTNSVIVAADFIPLVEETGLIIPLGDWVLKEVCKQQKKLSEENINVRLSVNISPRQFSQDNIVTQIINTVRTNTLKRESIECEITESCVMEEPEEAIKKISNLIKEGVLFSIDDFGTGYSSLSELYRFPVQNVKLDKIFVMNLEKKENLMLVKTIISLIHSMGLKVTAEGVETEEQFRILKSLGCDFYQGFYFSKPLSESDFILKIKEYK